MIYEQKTHSASITAGPHAYQVAESAKNKTQKIIELDCRGLEFTDFKADVSPWIFFFLKLLVIDASRVSTDLHVPNNRAIGRQKESRRRRRSLALICRKESGMTTTKRQARK